MKNYLTRLLLTCKLIVLLIIKSFTGDAQTINACVNCACPNGNTVPSTCFNQLTGSINLNFPSACSATFIGPVGAVLQLPTSLPSGVTAYIGTNTPNVLSFASTGAATGNFTFNINLSGCFNLIGTVTTVQFNVSSNCSATISFCSAPGSVLNYEVDEPHLSLIMDNTSTIYPTQQNLNFLKFDKAYRYYKVKNTQGILDYFRLRITAEDEIRITAIEAIDPATQLVIPNTNMLTSDITGSTTQTLVFNSAAINSFNGTANNNGFLLLNQYIIIRESIEILNLTSSTPVQDVTLYHIEIDCDENAATSPSCYSEDLSLNVNCKEKNTGLSVTVKSGSFPNLMSPVNSIPICPSQTVDYTLAVSNYLISVPVGTVPQNAGAFLIQDIQIPVNDQYFTFSSVRIGSINVPYTYDPATDLITISASQLNTALQTDPDGANGLVNNISNYFPFSSNQYGYRFLPEGNEFYITLVGLAYVYNTSTERDCNQNQISMVNGNVSFTVQRMNEFGTVNSHLQNVRYRVESDYTVTVYGTSDKTDLAPPVPNQAVLSFVASVPAGTTTSTHSWSLFHYGTTGQLINCPTLRQYASLVVPSGYTVVNPVIVNNPFTNFVTPCNVNAVQVTGTNEYIIDFSTCPLAHPEAVKLDITVQINCGGIDPADLDFYDDFSLEFRAECNSGCSTRYRVYGCSELQLFRHCPGDCGGFFPLKITDFKFNRNSFGWPLESSFTSGQATTINEYTPGIELGRTYECDRIKAVANGSNVVNNSLYLFGANTALTFEIEYDAPGGGANLYDFISGSFTLVNSMGTFVLPVSNTNYTTYISSGGKRIVNVNFPCSTSVTNNANTVTDFVYHILNTQVCAINFTGEYRINDNNSVQLSNGFHIMHQIRGQFTNTPLTSPFNRLGYCCDPYGDNMMFLKVTPTISFNTVQGPSQFYPLGRTEQCHLRYFLQTSFGGGITNSDDFPNEYRPIVDWPDVMKFKLPVGLEFLSAQFIKDDPNITTWQTVPFNFNTTTRELIATNLHTSLPVMRSLDKKGNSPITQSFLLTLTRGCPLQDPDLEIDQIDIATRAYSTEGLCHGDLFDTEETSPVFAHYNPVPVSESYDIDIDPVSPYSHTIISNTNPISFPVSISHMITGGTSIQNVWVYFTSTNPNVVSMIATDISTNLPLPTVTGSPGLFKIPSVSTSTPYQFNIKVQYNCADVNNNNIYDPVDINVHYGNSCLAYPAKTGNSGNPGADLNPVPCMFHSDVYTILPQISALYLDANLLTIPQNACQYAEFIVDAGSLGAMVTNANLTVSIPPGFSFWAAGSEYGIQGSNVQPLPNPSQLTGQNVWNINSLIQTLGYTYFGEDNLNPALLDHVYFKLRYKPLCSLGYLQTYNFNFNLSGTPACVTPALAPVVKNKSITIPYNDIGPTASTPLLNIAPQVNCNDLVPFTFNIGSISTDATTLNISVVANYDPAFTLNNSSPGGNSVSGQTTWTYNGLMSSLNISGNFTMPVGYCGPFNVTFNVTISESPASCCSQLILPPVNATLNVSACCNTVEGFCYYLPKPGADDTGREILNTDDDGFVIASSLHEAECDRDMYYLRYDQQYAMFNNLLIGDDQHGCEPNFKDEGRSIVQRNEDVNGQMEKFYYIAGNVEFSSDITQIVVTKVDENGRIIWTNRYYSTNIERKDVATKIIDMSPVCSDHLLIVGYTNSYEENPELTDMLGLQIRSNGTIANYKTYGSRDISEKAYDVVRVDQGFIIVGEINSEYRLDVCIVKINGKMDIVNSLIVRGEQDEIATGVTRIEDNIYVIGKTSSFGNNNNDNIYLVKTDVNLSAILETQYYGTADNIEIGNDIITTSDQHLLVAATVISNKRSGMLLKINPADLLPEWSEITTFYDNNDELFSVAEARDGRFFSTGYYESTEGNQEIFFANTSSDGISCCMVNYSMHTGRGGEEVRDVPYDSRSATKKHYGVEDNYYTPEFICQQQQQRLGSDITKSNIPAFVSIQPNPFSDQTLIKLEEKFLLINPVIIIYDLLGKQIKSIPMESNSAIVNNSGMTNGLYYFEIYSNGSKIHSGKLSLQK